MVNKWLRMVDQLELGWFIKVNSYNYSVLIISLAMADNNNDA